MVSSALGEEVAVEVMRAGASDYLLKGQLSRFAPAVLREVENARARSVTVAERRLAEERLLQLAHYDSLTGLPNRVTFYDRLHQALAQARRHDWHVAVMFVDLDRFKNINDTLGHAGGDRLLQAEAKRLADSLREDDTVGRMSGDEFAVILTNPSHGQDAHVVAQKLLDSLVRPFAIGGREIFVSASIGIALHPTDGSEPETLVRNADVAMYRAKELGRNDFQFYTAKLNAASGKGSVECELRRARAW